MLSTFEGHDYDSSKTLHQVTVRCMRREVENK